jgi:endonuclease/exonuclease/phosphatase (EEP) superfamily protein YafD
MLGDQLQSVSIDTLSAQPAAKPVARFSVRGLLTSVLSIVAVAALAVAVVGVLARYVPLVNHVFMFAAALSPYLMTAAMVSLVLFVLCRRWMLAIAATAVMLVGIAVELPLFISERNAHDTTSVTLRVMTANLYFGRAHANSLVATANASADVLAVQELTPESVRRLSAAGLDKSFPHRVLDARSGASGIGLWSRFPITASKRIGDYKLAMASARIRVEGVESDLAVLVAHMSGPWPQPIDDWRGDIRHMQGTMSDLAKSVGAGCAIVAGDFNSTPDMREFRSLLGDGYQDASEQAGAGFNRTYPADSRIPPIIAIDHVLTFQCTATSAETVGLPGSDHRGLVSRLEIPQSPKAS